MEMIKKKHLLFSCLSHFVILMLFIFNFSFSHPLPVLENTNQHDVISAVVLGDSPNSKILPKEVAQTEIAKENQEEKQTEAANADVVALQDEKKKQEEKLNQQKKQAQDKLRQQFLAENLLTDIKKQKKIKQKQLQAKFKKTLQHLSEQSMRQQLLNEDIKLKATESRQSQGEINKYKALILQAISENWLVPAQVNKKLFCELMIRLAPSGVVLDVQVIKSSGDVALDRSARAAVFKASPLPVPKDTDGFKSFRQFVLKVKPINIL